MDKLTLLQDWYRRVWIEGDLDAVDEYFAPQSGAEGLMPDGQVTAEDFRALVPALRMVVRDLRIEIDRHVECDDWLWVHVTAHAVKATGIEPVSASGQVMVRVADGRFVEVYNSFDFITFFEQLGLLPAGAFLLLLAGERIG
ncbi:ester cyclase [Albidovulum sp.]